MKLYAGNPVLFDKPGTVVLGCNIHDQMVADVQVVNTSYFGKKNMAGKAKLNVLSNGNMS
jgi:hypothetical protein